MDIAKGLIYRLESERVGIQFFSIEMNFLISSYNSEVSKEGSANLSQDRRNLYMLRSGLKRRGVPSLSLNAFIPSKQDTA